MPVWLTVNEYKDTTLRQREREGANPPPMNGRHKANAWTRFRLQLRLRSLHGQHLRHSRDLLRVSRRYCSGSASINSIPFFVSARSRWASFCPASSSGTGTSTSSFRQLVPRLGLYEA